MQNLVLMRHSQKTYVISWIFPLDFLFVSCFHYVQNTRFVFDASSNAIGTGFEEAFLFLASPLPYRIHPHPYEHVGQAEEQAEEMRHVGHAIIACDATHQLDDEVEDDQDGRRHRYYSKDVYHCPRVER